MNGQNFQRQQVLNVGNLKHLRAAAEVAAPGQGDHDGGMNPIGAVTQMTNNDFTTIYQDLPQE